jgi:hypothetical protein
LLNPDRGFRVVKEQTQLFQNFLGSRLRLLPESVLSRQDKLLQQRVILLFQLSILRLEELVVGLKLFIFRTGDSLRVTCEIFLHFHNLSIPDGYRNGQKYLIFTDFILVKITNATVLSQRFYELAARSLFSFSEDTAMQLL